MGRKKNLLLLALMLISFSLFSQGSVSDMLDKAEFFIQNQRFDEALSILKSAAAKDGKNATIFFKMATCHTATGNFKEAIDALNKATEINPKYYEAYEMLGNLHYQISNANKAVESFSKAYDTDPNEEHKLQYKLQILDILEKLNRQLLSYDHVVDAKKIAGESFEVFYFEALYFIEVSRYQEAIQNLEKVVAELKPEDGNEKYFFNLGVAYFNLAQYDKARENFKKADYNEYKQRIRQFTDEYYMSLAQTYFQVYEYDQAEQYLSIAMALNPTLSVGFELQKKLAAIKTDKSKIIQTQVNAISADKNPSTIRDKKVELANLYFQVGDYQEAMLMADALLKEDPRDIRFIYLKALCEYKLQHPAEAVEMLERVVKNPTLSQEVKAAFNFSLGIIYKESGDFVKSEEAFKNAFGGNFKAAVTNEFALLQALRLRKESGFENAVLPEE